MENGNINQQLKDLYVSKWTDFSSELNKIVISDDYKIKPSNPLLLSHHNPQAFENSDIKILIMGQENNDWGGVFNNNIESRLQKYATFYQGRHYNYRGVFNNHFNLLVNMLENRFQDKKLGFFWSNVIKVGKANQKGCPPSYILDATLNKFDVLAQEIEIIKPNLILFLSGLNYDKFIKSQINGLKIEPFKDYIIDEVAQLKIPNVNYAFRVYHPNKMNRLGKVRYEEIYTRIINELVDI